MIDKTMLWRILLGVGALLAIILLAIWAGRQNGEAADKPKVALLTSLPLMMQEGDLAQTLQEGAEPSPAISRLQETFEIVAIDDVAEIKDRAFALALLAQPRAFAPADYADLDAWISAGGRAIILADPALQWESEYPLGDSRRPLFTSMMSPLFDHWGLKLTLPMDQQEEELDVVLNGMRLKLAAAGAWQLVDRKRDSGCVLAEPPVLASCTIGKGRALLLADADMLDPALWTASLWGGDSAANIAWLISRLEEMAALGKHGTQMGKKGQR